MPSSVLRARPTPAHQIRSLDPLDHHPNQVRQQQRSTTDDHHTPDHDHKHKINTSYRVPTKLITQPGTEPKSGQTHRRHQRLHQRTPSRCRSTLEVVFTATDPVVLAHCCGEHLSNESAG